MALSMRRAVLALFPDARTTMLPVSDGGEGFVDVLALARGGERVEKEFRGPLPGQAVRAVYGISADGRSAVIEMAQAAGLTLIPPGRRDPKITTTFGVGELIRDALDRGISAILVGIGGSATNDGGAGMAEALGVRFLDRGGASLPRGGAALLDLARIDRSGLDPRVAAARFMVACDVRNPLVGPSGASAVYGPQKGATPADVELLDRALEKFRATVLEESGRDLQTLPGGGAAGGLGSALAEFCGAKLEPGIEIVLDAIGFDQALVDADLVLTGEGRIDRQTGHGKALGGILRRAERAGKPVLAVVGSFEGEREQYLRAGGFRDLIALVGRSVDLEMAIRDAAELIAQKTREMLVRFLGSSDLAQGKGGPTGGKD